MQVCSDVSVGFAAQETFLNKGLCFSAEYLNNNNICKGRQESDRI